MKAVVLAGGKTSPEMRAATGVENRALVDLCGKTMLEYVIDALVGAASVDEIVVAGIVPESSDYRAVPPAETFLENLLRGIESANVEDGERALIVTSDIPFITSDAIDDFVRKSLHSGAGFCYPIIPMDDYRKQFATLKRTTLKLADGEFTGGNVMVIDAGFIVRNQKAVREAYAARKNPMRLGSMLGWDLLGRLLLSKIFSPQFLSVKALEDGISHLLGYGATARAIVTTYASLGTDVDKPDDVIAARNILAP